MSEFNVNRDKWLESHGKKRNEWGNWTNVDIKEFENWAKNNEVAFDIKSILNEYENWADIPDEKKPWSPANIEKMKKAFDAGKKTVDKRKKTVMAVRGAADNILKSSFAGIKNNKGDSSLSGNPGVADIVKVQDKLKIQPKTTESAFRIETFENAARKAIENMEGKSGDEQKEIVSEILPEEKPEEKSSIPLPKVEDKPKPTFKETTEEIEQAERDKEINEKSSAFLKSWAATHPSWLKILSSSDLSWGQKVALVGSALANIGANVTLGAKSGFEHSGFNGIPWDFKQAIDKYTNQEIENVLNAEQRARAKELYANLFADMAEKYGDDKMQEIFAIADAYGDNPAQLKARLEAIGVKEDANAIKEAYKNREKISAEEQAKREKLDTEIKQAQAEIARLEAVMKTLDKEQKEALNKKIIEAQEAIQDYTKTKYKSDTKTYNLEKTAGYIHNIIKEAEGIAGTVGGVLTGGVVGSTSSIKDGIVRAKGIPQKIVRADGSEVILSPYDNVYATEKPLTTENDNGGEVVPMELKDEVYFQKRLGYSGGVIRKDFDYYLNILGA